LDGGNSWDQQFFGTDPLYGVWFINSNSGWIVGHNGLIMHTGNGGFSYVIQNSNTTATLYDVYFYDNNIGWTTGTAGTILKTMDGGSNWQSQNSGVAVPIN
jgi:photosystem II stability/assembly factor-like uncharacterized protein